MLGSMVVEVLAADPSLEVAGTVRRARLVDAARDRLPQVDWRLFEASGSNASLVAAVDGADWVINAIGLTKPYVHDDDPAEVERAIHVNAAFPFELAAAAAAAGAEVIQIATDCVFSGTAGRYSESAPHDALDVYGKTKSLGEAARPPMHLLRCSIIGPEPSTSLFLLEWLRKQPKGGSVNGYTDHLWNGVTTHAFARLCHAIVTGRMTAPDLQHVIPSGDVTKADLLVKIAKAFDRGDLTVVPGPAPYAIDRTLRTEHPDRNNALWLAAGYPAPPSIDTMLQDLAKHEFRLFGLPA
jgi:dTDP-4-dehydrorhamnose reductase